MQFVRQAPQRRLIFVSYCHDDHLDCREFVDYLIPACERLGDAALWVDFAELQGGSAWRQRIAEGLARATVFVVLMSQKYVNSRFCMNDELVPILHKVQRGDAMVIPVALHEVVLADFSVDDGAGGRLELAERQCLPQDVYLQHGRERTGLVPLSKWRGDRRDAWHAVRQQIELALNSGKRAVMESHRQARPPVAKPVAQPVAPPTAPPSSSRRLEPAYLCNRDAQSVRLGRMAQAWEQQGCRRPFVVITEAISDDRPDKWTQRLGAHEFAQALPLFDSGELAFGDPRPFSWPLAEVTNVDEASAHLLRSWHQALGGKARLVDEDLLHQAHAQREQPLLLWSDVGLSQTDETALDLAAQAFSALAAGWPDVRPSGLLVVALTLRHAADDSEPCRQRAERLVQALRQAAENGGFVAAHLGALPPVRQGDLDAWAALPAVEPLLQGADLETLREQLHQPQRMKRFASLCDVWLAGGLR